MPLAPPPIIAASLALVTQVMQRADMTHPGIVTFALNAGGFDAATVQDTIDDFQANFNANIAPSVDSEVFLPPPTIAVGDGTTARHEAVAAGAQIVGGGVLNSAAPQVAFLAKKTTGFGGKTNRGRTYWPYMLDNSNVNENGTINPAEVAALQVHMTAFLNQLTTDGTPMVIANRVFNVPLGSPPPRFVTHINMGNVVTAFTLEGVVATQRRRTGRG